MFNLTSSQYWEPVVFHNISHNYIELHTCKGWQVKEASQQKFVIGCPVSLQPHQSFGSLCVLKWKLQDVPTLHDIQWRLTEKFLIFPSVKVCTIQQTGYYYFQSDQVFMQNEMERYKIRAKLKNKNCQTSTATTLFLVKKLFCACLTQEWAKCNSLQNQRRL